MHIDLSLLIKEVSYVVVGWPLILFVVGVSFFCTFVYKFVQIRYFLSAWKLILRPKKIEREKGTGALTPLQAFLNSLSAALGNGSIAGVATSVYAGGPGSIFWMAFIGLFLMAIRFGEVYLSLYYQDLHAKIGGPTVYVKRLFCGRLLSYLYTFFTLTYAFAIGNAMQSNAVSVSLQAAWHIQPMIIAVLFFLFCSYVMLGGAQRILAVSDAIVPLKVVLFFMSALIVLIYHYSSLWSAFNLILTSAFAPRAIAGGMVGFTVQQAMRFGIFRCVMATESGLGTAGILFGSTQSTQKIADALMSMLVVFISALVSVLIGLCIILSGVWDSGLTSTALTIASYETVFGALGGWVVSALSLSFGIGLIVTYAFVARELWLYLTAGRFELLFSILYCVTAFIGALVNAHVVWYLGDIIIAGIFFINLTAVVYLTGTVRRGLKQYEQKQSEVA